MSRPGGPGDGFHGPASLAGQGVDGRGVTRASPLMWRRFSDGPKGVLPVYRDWDLIAEMQSGAVSYLETG